MRSWWQYCIPQLLCSRFLGWLALRRWVPLKNGLIALFVRYFNVDLSEAEQTDYRQYACFHDFFTRALKPGARSIDSDPQTVVSPVDGQVSELGTLTEGRILQAKHRDYSVRALLGGDAALAAQFHRGHFMTAYLSPKDYHRVHMPIEGVLLSMQYVPGRLFSVNARSVQDIHHLFARNERVVCTFQTARGLMVLVLVGAMVVGSMHTAWHGQVTPARHHCPQAWTYADQSIVLAKGEELGFFTLGSTVIVLFQENAVAWASNLQAESTLRLGQVISAASGGVVRA